VLVVDDHQLVAKGVAAMLETEDDLTVVGLAASGQEALQQAVMSNPDVVLMDYRLPDGTGVAASVPIRKVVPDARFVMLTASAELAVLNRAMEAGFVGFIEKSADIDELVTAVRAAAAGDVHFSSATRSRLMLRSQLEGNSVEALSGRELEVLRAVAAGCGTNEIAARLYISPNTVRNHVRSVLQKLEAHSKLEAVVIAARAGVIDLSDDEF
jgi:DNA-binding NarL/FixJ family response regulator